MLLSSAAVAQQGQGRIVVSRVERDGWNIQYTVTGGNGSPADAADFRCKILFPSGKGEELKGWSSPWRNGVAQKEWTFYGKEHGTYQVECLWNMDRMGTFAKAATVFQK